MSTPISPAVSQKMSLFSMLSTKAPNRVFASILLGVLAGVTYALLIPLMISALREVDSRFETVLLAPTFIFGLEVANVPVALAFALTCLFIVVCRTLSQVFLSRVSMNLASDLRVDMYERIARASVPALESIGVPKLVSSMTLDLPTVVAGTQLFPDLLVSSVTVLGMLGFLLYLNAPVFWFVFGAIIFGVITYQLPMLLGQRYFIRAGNSSDALQEAIQGLVRGVKELKLNDVKRRTFFDTMLLTYERDLLEAQQGGNTVIRISANYGEMLSFFIIGAVTFIFVNYRAINSEELLGAIMVLLYITGPIAGILKLLPEVSRSKVAMERVNKVFARLSDENISPASQTPVVWSVIRFEKVCYQHHLADEANAFKVGPIDLEFAKGQITLVVGGNGSGKSTLCKLLTLHYTQVSGAIYFDDTVIDRDSIATYRQSISAIYSDYYLFDRLLGINCDPEIVNHYLKVLKLDEKVQYQDGKFSTLALSDGQRRRMALLAAFVEDKQLYLFDEWAADQDPMFKEVFYHEILPSLRAMGKAVVAITHDDRYFDVADKVIVMADGMVTRTDLIKEPSYGLAKELKFMHASNM
jgi:putative ATP-binding cassette transporter